MNYLFARLAEPSTWVGIGTFVANFGAAVATHNMTSIVSTVLGAVAAAMPEGKAAA